MKADCFIIHCIMYIIILFSGFHGFSQDQALEEARKNEAENKITDAVRLYKTWLKENSGHAEFINIVQRVILLENNSKDLLAFLYEIESITSIVKEKCVLVESIARLEEFLGNLARAIEHYLYVYNNGTDENRFVSLLYAAQLFFKQGIIEKTLECINTINKHAKDKEILVKAGILESSVYRAQGEWNKARDNYIHLIKHHKSTTIYPVILLGYLECNVFFGNKEEINKIINVFKEYFPSSPEYSLALAVAGIKEDERILYYPNPSLFIYDLKDEADSVEPVKSDNKPDTVYIQTGSFIVLENAKDMVKELKRNNITAIIREKTINATNYYCVLIELESSEQEKINEYIVKLKEAGFEGFLVQEE